MDNGGPSQVINHFNFVEGNQYNHANHYHVVIQQIITTGDRLLTLESSNILPESNGDLRAISWQIAGIADQLLLEQRAPRGPVNEFDHDKLKREIQKQIMRAVELNERITAVEASNNSDADTIRDTLSWDSASAYFRDADSLPESLESSLRRLLDGPLRPPKNPYPSNTDTDSLFSVEVVAHPTLEKHFRTLEMRTGLLTRRHSVTEQETPSPSDYVWEAGDIMTSGLVGVVHSVAISADASEILCGTWDKSIRRWNIATAEQTKPMLRGHTDSISAVAYIPSRNEVISASYDTTIRIWGITTGTQSGRPMEGHIDRITSLAVCNSGSRAVSGSHEIRVWNLNTRQQIGNRLTGHRQAISSLAISPDGTKIVSTSRDNTLRLWTLIPGDEVEHVVLYDGSYEEASSVAYSPNGHYIVCGWRSGLIKIYDAIAKTQLGEPLVGHTREVGCVSFSEDGNQLVSGSTDATVRVWDMKERKPIGEPITGHISRVSSVAISKQGNLIVSGSWDRTVRVWHRKARTG